MGDVAGYGVALSASSKGQQWTLALKLGSVPATVFLPRSIYPGEPLPRFLHGVWGVGARRHLLALRRDPR